MIAVFRRGQPARDAAWRAYDAVVAQARQARFFTECRVPDTVDGRFELICLHAFLYLDRLKAERVQTEAAAQLFFDAMFADLDRSLREMGTGDLSVGRHVNRMAEAFYGRMRAYETGLTGPDAALEAALARNLFGTVPQAQPPLPALAAYIRREAEALLRQPVAALLAGQVMFGPAPGGSAGGEPTG